VRGEGIATTSIGVVLQTSHEVTENIFSLPITIMLFHYEYSETKVSEEAEMERLLRENENRGKTPEQQIREGMMWEPIEEKKARERERAGTPVKNFSQGETGLTRDIVARRVGLGSGITFEKGKAVVEYMDSIATKGYSNERRKPTNAPP
jgi:hypothetical protein